MTKKIQTVAIIGATGGIGSALAEHFVKYGSKVILASRTEKDLLSLQSKIDPKKKSTVCLPTDAGVPGEVTDMLRAGTANFGFIDLVITTVGTWRQTDVNTDPIEAGQFGRVLLETITNPSWNAIFETYKHSAGTKIINMSSHVVLKGEDKLDGNIHYRAAKVAVESLVDSIRKSSNVAWIANLRPALVDTPKNRLENPSLKEKDWKRAIQPKEIFDWIIKNYNRKKPVDKYFRAKTRV